MQNQDDSPENITKFWLPTPSGPHIGGVIHRKSIQCKDIVVLCHGAFSTMEIPMFLHLSKALRHNICRFDFVGNGISEGKLQYGNHREESGEIRLVVEYLRREGWNVICLIGHSKGFLSCLLYAQTYNDIPLMVNLSGRFDMTRVPTGRFTEQQYKELKENGYTLWNARGISMYLTQEDLDKRCRLDVRAIASNLKCKVLTVHGNKDRTTPVEDAYSFASTIPNHKLVVVPEANHFFTRPTMWPIMCDAVVDFLSLSCCD